MNRSPKDKMDVVEEAGMKKRNRLNRRIELRLFNQLMSLQKHEY